MRWRRRSTALTSVLSPLTEEIRSAVEQLGHNSHEGVQDLVKQFSDTLQGGAGSELRELGGSLQAVLKAMETVRSDMGRSGEAFAAKLSDAAQNLNRVVVDAGDNLSRQSEIKLDPLQSAVREQMALRQSATRSPRALAGYTDELASEGLSVQIDEASGVLRLNEDAVRFAPNHADLLDFNKDNVGKIARVLERVLSKYVSCRGWQTSACSESEGTSLETLFIEGHTDTTGIDNNNWVLSTERAVNTYRELIAVSPSLRLLRNNRNEEVISVSGYSSTRPIDPRAIHDAWDRNRRIDLRFVMDNDPRRMRKSFTLPTKCASRSTACERQARPHDEPPASAEHVRPVGAHRNRAPEDDGNLRSERAAREDIRRGWQTETTSRGFG